MGSDYSNMDSYSLLDVLINSDIKISVKPNEVAKNIASHLNSLGASVDIYINCPVTNAANMLCKKYKQKNLKRKN